MCVITLTTDFGRDSSYVAAMKGVILSINPSATVVDISHGIGPQNIAEGAFVLGEGSRWFPPETIHVAVVDPGVGTSRRIVFARVGGQRYLCPDNGLLSYVCREALPDRVHEVTNRTLFLPAVSNTFHGRDIMAPVAARLSLGLPAAELGGPINDIHLLDWPRSQCFDQAVVGCILAADSFGNLITNIHRDAAPGSIDASSMVVEAGQYRLEGVVGTYLDAPIGTAVALFGSSGLLELAIVQGNAAAELKLPVGTTLAIKW